MSKIEFGVIGAGWRCEFFIRIARACPDRFKLSGVVARNPEKAAAFEAQWGGGVKTFRMLDQLLEQTSPSFVITSESWDANPELLKQLAARGMPALSETPPAPDVERMTELFRAVGKARGKIQVAEQVHLRPHHQAQLAVAHSGKLGRISQAQVSVAHGYHGISLMRRLLGISFEDCTISGSRFRSPIVKGPGRAGPPEKETVGESTQDFFRFDFGDQLGTIDFTGDQYFAWIRNERLLVRGDRGEIADMEVSWLKDFRTPLKNTFVRHHNGLNGDLSPHSLAGIQLGDEWVFRNPFPNAALMDDEIAIATALVKMDECARTGREFYPLAEGMQDHYLNLLAQQATAAGAAIQSQRQVWAS